MTRVIAYSVLWLLASAAFAGDRDYQCVVLNHYRLQSDGSLTPDRTWVGDRFAVDRIRGKATDGPFVRGEITHVTVVDSGGSASAFKAVYITPGYARGGDAEVIQIREFGNEPDKAFVAITLLSVYSGTCR